MNLERLLREGNDEEQRLLKAALSDGPSTNLHDRVYASLGMAPLPSALDVPRSDAYASPPKAPSGTTTSLTPTATLVKTAPAISRLIPWIGIGALCGGIGVGAALFQSSTVVDRKVQSVTLQAHRVSPIADEPTQREPSRATHPTHERTPTATASTTPKVVHERMRATETQHNLEIQLVDAARSALQRGDSKTCLKKLEERTRHVGKGMLLPEATLLRVRALLALGRSAAATQEAERYLAKQPSGAIAERIRAAVATARTAPNN